MIPCLSSGLAKNNNLLVILKVWLFSKMGGGGGGGRPYTKAVKQDILANFSKVQQRNNIFLKSSAILTKSKDKPNSRYILKTFSTKSVFCAEK